MKLKKVEIQGFKTFVDRTQFIFNAGITGVVGPNGCGKSNIVDAIRWVLGENNPRTLRGSQMEDIIFNGSDVRPPLGMAEVILTLDNEDGSAPAQYASHAEISVCRRVFRDGESEYLINKIPCRLKDIGDLFMGTGATFYSIVEQGRISSIVSAKPEELRTFIEEAAGITFYRARKRSALRRIEATQQNLIRVSDILSEISRQIRYLERQARKAEKYREVRDQLRNLELGLSQEELKLHSQQLQELDQQAELHRQQIGEQRTLGQGVAANLEELRLQLHGLEAGVQSSQKNLFDAGKALAEAEKQQEYLRKESVELAQRQQQLQSDLTQNHEKLSRAQSELENSRRQLGEIGQANAGQHQLLASLETLVQNAEADLQAARQTSSDLQAALMQAFSQTTALTHQLEALQNADTKHVQSQDKWQTERDLATAQLLQFTKLKNQFHDQQQELGQLLQLSETELGQLKTDLQQCETELQQSHDALNSCREARAHATSKLESLLALEKAADVTQFIEQNSDQLSQHLIGKLSQLVRVPDLYERAVESYLGYKLNWLVVNDDKHPANLMLQILNAEQSTRATLVPQNLPLAKNHATVTADPDSGLLGTMASLITPLRPIAALLNYLCGDVLLVKDLASAARLAPHHPGFHLVTLQGEIVGAGGEVTAGAFGGSAQGILHRRREITLLQEEVAQLNLQLENSTTQLQQQQQSKRDLEVSLNQKNDELNQLRLKLAENNKDLDRAVADLQRCENELQKLEVELNQADSSYQGLVTQRHQLIEALAKAQTEHETRKSQSEAHQQLLNQLSLNLEQAQENWTQARVSSASAMEREDNLTQQVQRLENECQQCQSLASRYQDDLQRLQERQDLAVAELATLETSLHGLREQVVSFEAAFQGAQRSYQTLNSELQEREQQRREKDQNLHRLERELDETQFHRRELMAKRDHLRQQMIEKWKVDLDAVAVEELQVTDELRQQVQQLREQLDGMGEVNLGAVEEHAFLKDRFDFLSAQRTDLEQSLDSLQKTIRKIDTTTKELFFAAFEGINKELKVMFPRLFQGGRAEMVMIGDETQDPLERGMSIIAHPPGKRPQHINLLSGGEKSMTAAALIFAIFKFKPAPFSILDEIDAALDDENTRRLNNIAKEISSVSQLVVITHNKRTMEIAQNLYGVTMEEAGVSKVVSVRLEESPAHISPSPEPQAAAVA